MKVNLFDNTFSHTKDIFGVLTSSMYPPKNIEWVERLMTYDGTTVFTDDFIISPIVDSVKSTIKAAWLFEPPAIIPEIYQKIVDVENKFDFILTFDKQLLDRGPKYIKYIVGQTRVPDDIANFYEKSKHISLISSGKTMAPGHLFRGEIAHNLSRKHNIDLWGYAFRPFEKKTEPLIDYQFNISVMNSKLDNYFTDILLDCFRLGTIPIFWGCPNIGEYFDVSGMETFDTIEDLDTILTNLKPYKEYIRGAKENFYQAKKYLNTDDYIASILKKL